jgi:xanthine dehydrogenase YagT iron-sulfur-binding subunit
MKRKDDDRSVPPDQGVTRRGFIKSMGAGAAAVATSSSLLGFTAAEAKVVEPQTMHKITLKVNKSFYTVLAEPRWSLLFVLREKLGLTGTKVGCERGECGACTVLIDGVPRYACLTLALEAEGAEITTIEGLMEGEELGPVQQAFVERDGLQCGYCTSGQIMAAEGLLIANPNPTAEEIQKGMSGNLCRCGAYVHIFEAVEAAATNRRGR